MQSEINLISEDASSKMGYMLNKYIHFIDSKTAVTWTSRCRASCAISCDSLHFRRENVLIRSRKAHHWTQVPVGMSWRCYEKQKWHKAKSGQDKRTSRQFKSSWIYYGNTRGGNNWVNINPCDTDTAQEEVLRHKWKYYRESVEGLIWGCHRSIRLYVRSVQCCKHCKSSCSRGGFKNRLTGSSFKDMPMHRHGGILDVSHRQINSVNHHFEHCGHTLSSSRNIFGRI